MTLTQGDVRELQLAKAAIAAGIRLLRERFGPPASEDVPIFPRLVSRFVAADC